MQSKFFPGKEVTKAKLKDKREVANGTMLFVYDLLGEKVNFTPGQYFHVAIKEGLKHHFTIVNSPNENGILSHVTRMRDSEFKNILRDLPIGAEVEVYKIKGEFILPDDTSIPIVLIALGIGITPYISILRFIKEENRRYKITLICSDSDKQSMAFLQELERYAKNNPNFRLILTITGDESWTGEKRHVDGDFIKDHFENPADFLYYISGPPKAVESVLTSLEKVGIDKSNIKTENFTGY